MTLSNSSNSSKKLINFKDLKENHYKLMNKFYLVYDNVCKDRLRKFFYLQFLTELYIKQINKKLINSYSKLKLIKNMDIEEEAKDKLWLENSIKDCQEFNAGFSNSNSNFKIFFGLITAIFPTIILPIIKSLNFEEVQKKMDNSPYNAIFFIIYLIVIYTPFAFILINLIRGIRFL